MNQAKLLRFGFENVFQTCNISTADWEDVGKRLGFIRQQLLTTELDIYASGDIPEELQPLDAGFIRLPDRILAEYDSSRSASELGRILDASRRLSEQVDRVVVLGIGGSYMGAKALMDACTEPYFNERSRADRGGRPRVYFAGNGVDNDRVQGLLDLLRKPQRDDDARWGLVVISKSGGTLETAVAFRQFFNALRDSVSSENELSRLIVPITGKEGKLAKLADEIGCQARFEVPDGVGGRFSVLSAVGLFPAALMGLDIVALLRGAWMFNSHFEHAPFGNNPVLDYVAVNHLLEVKSGLDIRVLSVWNDALEACGLWYDQLLSESLGKRQKGATPYTAVNTRDLHSRAQQHQQGKNNKVFNNLVVDSWRYDPLSVGSLPWNHDALEHFNDFDLPIIMQAAIDGTNEALREDGRPTTTISLPVADENSLGQLFQMMMLATVVEGRLLGINPYGQPGVEKYKKNMLKILNERAKTGVVHVN
ncbi:MAG TPA: glucose-6-phosphate isomerase [Pirellulaceae bacterium]|nr:glucose-6-phosphate isomerase [Pirellulaceae bacterium]HMO92650.1 glucose-6-phosphate isomerase [Pirellulaceae bacterium]HMP70202.1 glucose-6-phosphate isomerase [Pirellulaceae bacterium]